MFKAIKSIEIYEIIPIFGIIFEKGFILKDL